MRKIPFLDTRPGIGLSVVGITGIGLVLATLAKSELTGLLCNLAILGMLFGYTRARGRGLELLGLGRPRSVGRTIALGVGAFLVATLLLRLVLEPGMERLLGTARDLSRFDPIAAADPAALLAEILLLWINAALFEEAYFRGFLIPAIAESLGSGRAGWTAGLLLSTAFFALLHAYQGAVGLIVTGAGALYLAAVFLGFGRNLWIAVIAHGLFDTSGLLLKAAGVYREFAHLIIPASGG